MTETELRNKVCMTAKAWLGCQEADGSHHKIIDIYNAGKLPGTYSMTYTDPWCAAFVSAVGMAAGLPMVILPHVNCDGMIAAYRAVGRFVEDDNYLPTPGDVIFYDWQDSGVGDNTGSSDHVGLVVAVEGGTITVIEGNKSDSVSYRTIQRGGRYIRGYAVPDYTGATSGETAQDEPIPTPAPDPERVTCTIKLLELQRGDTGETVIAAQGILIARGCSVGPDGADGDFGYNTRNGVSNFQRSHGLDVDGVIGQQTWAKLLGGKMISRYHITEVDLHGST